MHLVPPTADDRPFLAEMLVEAAFPLTPEKRPGALDDDHLVRYLDTFGQHPADVGLVAWKGDRRLGAAWAVHLPAQRPGYGWVGLDVPELAVAAVEGGRGRGVGRALVTGVLDGAAAQGVGRVSLSVNLRNERAHRLYRSIGFAGETPHGEGDAVTMVAPTNPRPPVEGENVSPGQRAGADDGPALARLRRVMLDGVGAAVDGLWVEPFLRAWPERCAAGDWVGAVVAGPDGRTIAAALAAVDPPPGGHAAVTTVATEGAWRRRGAASSARSALLTALDDLGVELA